MSELRFFVGEEVELRMTNRREEPQPWAKCRIIALNPEFPDFPYVVELLEEWADDDLAETWGPEYEGYPVGTPFDLTGEDELRSTERFQVRVI